MMTSHEVSSEWWGGADICVAIVGTGKSVDWALGSYLPDVQIWVPERSFELIASVTSDLGCSMRNVEVAMSGDQLRLSAETCARLLERWSDVEDAVSKTPAAGWAVAMRLVFQQCNEADEILIEGP